MIGLVDEFILLDDVQYTPRDWRNRNRIKTANGTHSLTIPVHHNRNSRISDVKVDRRQGDWGTQHLSTILNAYKRAPFTASLRDSLAGLYGRASRLDHLSQINRLMLIELIALLQINTPLSS